MLMRDLRVHMCLIMCINVCYMNVFMMRVYVSMCVLVYVQVCGFMNVWTCECMQVCICMCECTSVYQHGYICVHACVHIVGCVCVCVYAWVFNGVIQHLMSWIRDILAPPGTHALPFAPSVRARLGLRYLEVCNEPRATETQNSKHSRETFPVVEDILMFVNLTSSPWKSLPQEGTSMAR